VTAPNISGFKLSKGIKRLIVWGALALVLIIAAGSLYGFVNTTNSEGVRKTAALTAQYDDNKNELSSYILKFNETLGVADRQSTRLNDILENAVKGRYDNDGSLDPGTGGELFSAITEAYPDLSANSEAYMKVQDEISAGRDAYKNKQSKLLDMVRDFDTWRNTGLIKRNVVAFLGFPGSFLTVTNGGQTYTGEAALEQVRSIVLTDEAVAAYENGTQAPLITPEGEE
jgi:hypothetical protein